MRHTNFIKRIPTNKTFKRTNLQNLAEIFIARSSTKVTYKAWQLKIWHVAVSNELIQ